MESFYGGRQGASFVLVKSFATKQDMIDAFAKGGAYTAVHYDEYVIINTKNKNNKDNGAIYRRGYDYTNSLGGAIYVGTVVGPAGHSPQVQVTTMSEVANHVEEAKANGEDYISGVGQYNLDTGSMPSGKTADSISYSYCSVRTADGTDTYAYIGFAFPYTVMEAKVGNSSNKSVSITRKDDKTKPFYYLWQFNFPNTIQAIRLTTWNTENTNGNTVQDFPSGLDKTVSIYVSDMYDVSGTLVSTTYVSTAEKPTWQSIPT